MQTQARYPDTLNLPARAALAINALTSLRDESLNGQIYFYARLYEEPPTAYHAVWDYGDGTGRHADALTLAHIMTGSQQALDVAQELAELLMTWLGDKGLLWWPQETWTTPGPASTRLWRLVRDPKPEGPVAEVGWSQRGPMMGLTSLYLLTGNDLYRQRAQAIVDGLDDIALRNRDYRFMPELVYPQGGWRHTEEPSDDGCSELINGPIILTLLRFYEATGYEPALNLAGGLIRFILHRAEGYELDGRFHKTKGFWNHFHSKAAVITGVIRYGLATRQPEYVAWGRQAYDAARHWGTDFGWFPEDITIPTCCETCCITDMIECAILLGLHVAPTYLSDAERYGRNHLVESQFLDTAWLARIPRKPAGQAIQASPRCISNRDIVQRSLGSFSGFSGPNDLFGEASDTRLKIMQCCNGAGTRALYDLWHYAADDDGRRARVHMAFSRPTAWGDIVSHAPYVGRLDVYMKASRTVGIRIPDWVPSSELKVSVGGSLVRYERKGSYVWLDGLQPGDLASVQHDLPLTCRTYVLGDDKYVANFKGDTVLNMTPRGQFAPIYQRDRYQLSKAPEAERLWHLPSKEIASV